jgi:hypothetical protein
MTAPASAAPRPKPNALAKAVGVRDVARVVSTDVRQLAQIDLPPIE